MREPLTWSLALGPRADPSLVATVIRGALSGPTDQTWSPPAWLLPHQRAAAQRVAGRLTVFRGALLADAMGLGKTYVALALATRGERAVAVVPAALLPQWGRAARGVGVRLTLISHEALSRGAAVPGADLLIVDEAHRFRNPDTLRYDALARAAHDLPVLLLTATPLVNRAADVAHLLRLFLADNALALFGVRSLEAAAGARTLDELAHALSALAVARTPGAVRLDHRLPGIRDAGLHADPTVPPPLLDELLRRIEGLAFPTLGEPAAAELLRLHLFGRLASSAPALETTLLRHRRYLDHAIVAARRGERIRRRALLALFGPEDDAQLALAFPLEGKEAAEAAILDPSCLLSERGRVVALLDALRAAVATPGTQDPKAARLREVLAARNGGKTVVFTAAIPTALHLARWLRWQRVAVATGRGARIASGPLPLAEALALFAPRAQDVAAPPRAARADVLIATDLVSEGLNLQDAASVVHYDLPWSPLRLAQRLGRIARLGSSHETVDTWWFAPPAPLAERLAIARRIAEKARAQLHVGAAATSDVGRAHLEGGLFDWREADAPAPEGGSAGYAVVRGPLAAVFVLVWRRGTHAIPELLVMEGRPPGVVLDERRIRLIVRALTSAPAGGTDPPATFLPALRRVVRARLAAVQCGPRDADTLRLMRRVVRRARPAARARAASTIAVLDQWLDRLVSGLPVGALRELSAALGRPGTPAAPRRPAGEPGTAPTIHLAGALFGDGAVAGSLTEHIFVRAGRARRAPPAGRLSCRA